MKWFSTIKSSSSLERSLKEAALEAKAGLGKEKADLAFIFVSAAFRSELIDLWSDISKSLGAKHFIGCTGGGVIGNGNECEDQAAVSLTVASLPKVNIKTFQFQQENLPDGDAPPKKWRDLVGIDGDQENSFMVFSDPFSLDVDSFIAGLDFAFPHSPKVGGLASGGTQINENLLICDGKVFSKGAVGVVLSGNIKVEAVVAQGCRPIGDPLTITSSDGNVLMEVGNTTPLTYLQGLYDKLSPRDQELLQSSLFLGILMDPFKKDPKQGDFLIRNIIGLDQNNGMMAIGSFLRKGQTVQFHLRDANTSRDDLHVMLRRSKTFKEKGFLTGNPANAGAVLFSCLGRGKRLYGKENYDSSIIKSVVGDIPIGGFFCNGEIGPVSGRTYLHGYTSSIALFTEIQENNK